MLISARRVIVLRRGALNEELCSRSKEPFVSLKATKGEIILLFRFDWPLLLTYMTPRTAEINPEPLTSAKGHENADGHLREWDFSDSEEQLYGRLELIAGLKKGPR